MKSEERYEISYYDEFMMVELWTSKLLVDHQKRGMEIHKIFYKDIGSIVIERDKMEENIFFSVGISTGDFNRWVFGLELSEAKDVYNDIKEKWLDKIK